MKQKINALYYDFHQTFTQQSKTEQQTLLAPFKSTVRLYPAHFANAALV